VGQITRNAKKGLEEKVSGKKAPSAGNARWEKGDQATGKNAATGEEVTSHILRKKTEPEMPPNRAI